MLSAGDMTPYTVARPLYNATEMNAVVKALKNKGYEIGVISYADAENLEAATAAKMEWLKITLEGNARHLLLPVVRLRVACQAHPVSQCYDGIQEHIVRARGIRQPGLRRLSGDKETIFFH